MKTEDDIVDWRWNCKKGAVVKLSGRGRSLWFATSLCIKAPWLCGGGRVWHFWFRNQNVKVKSVTFLVSKLKCHSVIESANFSWLTRGPQLTILRNCCYGPSLPFRCFHSIRTWIYSQPYGIKGLQATRKLNSILNWQGCHREVILKPINTSAEWFCRLNMFDSSY